MTTQEFTCYQVQEPRAEYGAFQRVKTATVQTQHYMNSTKANPTGKTRAVPWINLRGQWLEQAGFTCGKQYQIEVYKNTLVLTTED